MKGKSVARMLLRITLTMSVVITFAISLVGQSANDIKVIVTLDSEPSTASAEIAPLKYNKRLPLSMQVDDGFGKETQSIILSPEITTNYWVLAQDDISNEMVTDTIKVVVEDPYIIDHSPLTVLHVVGVNDTLWVEPLPDVTVKWDNGSTDTSIIVDPEVSTIYTLKAYYNDELVDSLEFTCHVANFPEFTFDTVCFGDSTTLVNITTANDSIIEVLWDLNGDTKFDDAEGDTVTYKYDTSGVYLVGMRVYFKNDPMEVVYNAVPVGGIPVADFDYNNICLGSTTEFDDISTVDIGEIISWYWDFGNSDTSDFKDETITYDGIGTYTVIHSVLTNIGCGDTVTKEIEIVDTPEIVLSLNDGEVIADNDTVYFNEGSEVTISIEDFNSYDSVVWFDGSTSGSVIIAEEGDFYINVFKNGCDAYQEFHTMWGVEPQPSGNSIMNLITPNGDGYNDYWIVNDSTITTPFTVSIYNRNGKLVFNQDNYDNTWSGTYNGNVLPQGTYYYIVEDADNKKVKGSITIIR